MDKFSYNSSHALFACTALFLLALAHWNDSWTVINTSSASVLASSSPSSRLKVRRVSFSPKGYCLVFANGTSNLCKDFSNLIFHFASQEDEPLASALAGWCKVTHTKSWMVQGIDKLSCLFVLDGSYYLLVLCYVLAGCVACCTAFALVRNRCVDMMRNALTITAGTVTMCMVCQWCFYVMFFIDSEQLAARGLVVSFGESFRLVVVASWMYGIAGYMGSQASGLGLYRFARLHPAEAMTAVDPLSCPANYNV